MLLQMLRICGFNPIVAVVSNENKRDVCMRNGAHHVIVKVSLFH